MINKYEFKVGSRVECIDKNYSVFGFKGTIISVDEYFEDVVYIYVLLDIKPDTMITNRPLIFMPSQFKLIDYEVNLL